ncbi:MULTISPECIES: DoxX family protein [Nocardia]|uniref:DoxX family protein n=1 Tax=Nocardia TaxID=1817 RepID=UPI001894916D|nr:MULTISPECIES: DoxX family membrane protein [Nocardia]MBF6352090.1 DoxX family membrane protein [Nocardia flavorosea]
MLIRRLARPLLASTFVANGVETLMHPQSRVQEASNLVVKGQESLPSNVASSLPSDPDTLVKVTAAVQIAGGTLLALGKAPRPAALALAATVVPATVTEQNFWAETDPERKAAKRTAFLKDMGLLGGLMIAAADTAGKPSLGWRGRRAARKAAATVGGALPVGASSRNGTGEMARHQLQQAAERGQELAGTVAGKGAELAELTRERGPDWAEAAKHRGSEWADIAKHRGSELAEIAKHRGGELADTVQNRGPGWAEAAKGRAAEIGDIAKHRGGELADTAQARGPVWAETAKRRAAGLADVAKHRGEEVAEAAKHRGSELAGTAQAKGPELTEAAKNRAAGLADYSKNRGGELGAAAKQQRAQLKKQRAQLEKAYRKGRADAAKHR